MQKPSRQSEVTPEHTEEARRLRALWTKAQQARKEAGGSLTQEQAGAEFGIGTQAAVGFFLNGRTPLSPKAAAAFARALGCAVAEFSPRLARVLETGTKQPADEAWLLAAYRRLKPPEREKLLAIMAAAFPELTLPDPEPGAPTPKPGLGQDVPSATPRGALQS
jgi:transcriptional regulator with XRE-family HTH domain